MDGSCKLSNPSLLTDLKSLLSVVKTRRSMVFAYGFMFAFVACTAFFFFNSPADTSLWFTNLFTSSNSTDTSSLNSSASIFSYILPDQNPSSSATLDNTFNFSRSTNVSNRNTNLQTPPPNPNLPVKGNEVSANATTNPDRNGKGLSKTTNVTDSGLVKGNLTANRGISVGGSSNRTGNVEIPASNQSDSKGTKVFILNSPSKSNESVSDRKNKEKPVVYDQGKKKEVPKDCDIFYGRWVRDESYPLYKEGSCPFIDEPFDCFLNHRPDNDYQKFRWQPNGCNIPRLNAIDMLQRLRGKRLVFVGDSLNRNMWESLVCVLRNSVPDKKTVFEASGNRQFRTEGLYSFIFTDYNCSVEFFRAPFLVQESEIRNRNGSEKETLRLDIIEKYSFRFKDADILVFNTGHWWTHPKTSEGKDYYQEGDRVYSELNVLEAYKKALRTWARWVDTHINPKKTHVFFRGYSASHFRGGQWNSGGQCHKETNPITNDTYLEPYPPMMGVLESVIKEMKTPISYLNITRMTDYRKDAHPSIYRKPNLTEEERFSPDRFQDCSHWCLPGLPDTWNELLYAVLLMRNQ